MTLNQEREGRQEREGERGGGGGGGGVLKGDKEARGTGGLKSE